MNSIHVSTGGYHRQQSQHAAEHLMAHSDTMSPAASVMSSSTTTPEDRRRAQSENGGGHGALGAAGVIGGKVVKQKVRRVKGISRFPTIPCGYSSQHT